MITLDVSTAQVERTISNLARTQLPFAMSRALNDVMTMVKDREPAAMERELKSPTPFTKRAMFVSRASKRNLSGIVGYKDVQAGYLRLQAEGGTRLPKKKAILVPVKQRLNKYGNMPKGAVGRVIARPNTFVATKSGKSTSHLRPGIYKRPKRGKYRKGGRGNKNVGTNIGPQLLIAFEDRARYRAVIKFEDRGTKIIRDGIGPALSGHLVNAVKTARR